MDIHTTWVERRAIRGKSRQQVVEALQRLDAELPFRLRGVDSDTGSEFINEHLWAFCTERPAGQRVQFTRSRPYNKKDANAHVAQKNWTHVRKLVGWERYDGTEALEALNALYADLRLFQNLFQPSMKLVRKVRVGSRRCRQYDRPQTPFERGKACGQADPTRLAALKRVHTTNPFVLSRRIDQHLERLWALATRRPDPHNRETVRRGGAGRLALESKSRNDRSPERHARRGNPLARPQRQSSHISQL